MDVQYRHNHYRPTYLVPINHNVTFSPQWFLIHWLVKSADEEPADTKKQLCIIGAILEFEDEIQVTFPAFMKHTVLLGRNGNYPFTV